MVVLQQDFQVIILICAVVSSPLSFEETEIRWQYPRLAEEKKSCILISAEISMKLWFLDGPKLL